MRRVGDYDVEDPRKIQGRDEVEPSDRSLAGLRLRRALDAIPAETGRWLVLGCGAGRYVRALERARPGLELHGGDLSLTALKEARSRDRNAHYVALDSSALPYRDTSFEAVVFFDLLEHVPTHDTMLAEIQRVLKPGGALHFFVPLEGQPGSLYDALRGGCPIPIHRWKRDHVGHVHRFDDQRVLSAVWQAGLQVDDIAYSFHVAGQVHDVIDYWQRERQAGGSGILPRSLVHLFARLAFVATWRLSYLEDRLYRGRVLSSGIHVTATKADVTGR